MTVKDTWVDRATPMAGDLGRIGVRPVAGLAAPFLVRSVKSCRPGARGDGCEQDDEGVCGAIMRCRSRTGSAVLVRTARWRA